MRPQEAQTLLRVGFERFRKKLLELAAAALEVTDDLFEATSHIPDGEVAAFRQKRPEWLAQFGTSLTELFDQRLAGRRRKGLRPDADASLSALRVLTAFDHEKQAALTRAARLLFRFTRQELAALDLRVGVLLEEVSPRDLDNPFAIPYVLDAMGSTSRAVYPDPRVWRTLMERVVSDLTPNINGPYIALNRLLADHGVLPEIKAALRARSEHRPDDDRELLATFTHMLHDVDQPPPKDIQVPEASQDADARPPLNFNKHSAPTSTVRVSVPQYMESATILAGLTALASLGATGLRTGNVMTRPGDDGEALTGARDPAKVAHDFPSLDPMMALGTSTALFATLAQWQKLDLHAAVARLAPPPADGGPGEGILVPFNLIPHIRTAIAPQITNPADGITVDVIGLLFDYIFRDPSIADSTRALFGRLQVPIVKAALLDRTFFSDKRHPARRLLDDLADAAVGAANDEPYRSAFEVVARKAIERICANFEIDVAVFREADLQLLEFVSQENQKSAAALSGDVAKALHAEADEADRAVVRVLLRDRLAGIDIPFEVRSFIETIWADYVYALRREHGADSIPANAALELLDNMLWSIAAKGRTAQKARLTKMIPLLIGGLRAGCRALQVPAERSKSFFEALYLLHIAAIKPTAPVPQPATMGSLGAAPAPPAVNVHDYVADMVVGTWLQFDVPEGAVDARLNWVSPLRTKYIFTSRSRSRALILTPEELAWQLGNGIARLVIEPVALWDRAVSAALDTLAARKPPAAPGAAVPAPALA